jgi:WD40 repeat protein
MRTRNYAFIVGCLLLTLAVEVSTGDTRRALADMPTQIIRRVPITVENARQLRQIGRIGRGGENDLAWSPDHTLLAIASQAGLWLYTVQRPNAQPHLLGSDSQKISSLAFSPDGTLLAAASEQGIQLWAVKSEQPIGQAWAGEGDYLAFHPDGRHLAAGSERAIQLWDITTRQPVGPPFPGKRTPIAFSADGIHLAIGLSIWDIDTHKLVIELQDRTQALRDVRHVAFSPDGTRLVAADYDLIASWTIKTGGQIGVMHHSIFGIPMFLEFDRRGALQITYQTLDASLAVYDVNSKTRLLKFPLGFTGVSAGFQEWQFAPDGRFIVVHKAWMGGSMVLAWNTDTLASIGEWTDNVPSIAVTRIRPDGSLSVLTWKQNVEQLWAWKDGKARVVLTFQGVSTTGYTPDETELAVAYEDGTIRVWDVRTGRRVAILPGLSYVSQLTISPDGKLLAAWGDIRSRRTLLIWNIETGKPTTRLQGGAQDVVDLVFRPDSKALAACDSEGNIWLWDVESGKQLLTLKAKVEPYQGNGENSLTFSPDGMYLVATAMQFVSLWNLRTGTETAEVNHDSTAPNISSNQGYGLFSPDGQSVVLVAGRAIQLYHADSGKRLLNVTSDYSPIVRLSPDGSRLAVIQKSGVQVWQTSSGTLLFAVDEPAEYPDIGFKEFSPDGAILFLGKQDGLLQLWDAHTGKLLTTLKGHTEYVYEALFSPDWTLLLTVGADLTARLWAVEGAASAIF